MPVVVGGTVKREEGTDDDQDVGVRRNDIGHVDAARDGVEDLSAVDEGGAADDDTPSLS